MLQAVLGSNTLMDNLITRQKMLSDHDRLAR
jgi:hypothetical protein